MSPSSVPWRVYAGAGAFDLPRPACHKPARTTSLPTVPEHSDCAMDFVGMQMWRVGTPRPCRTEQPVELPPVLAHWWAAMSLPNERQVEATYRLREGLAAGVPLMYLPCQYCGQRILTSSWTRIILTIARSASAYSALFDQL